ncbi:MAG: hypothetical protein EXR77_08990 [Myxococcales bacterium]|nr:hypothetical protein [Myxococcales bacterium]
MELAHRIRIQIHNQSQTVAGETQIDRAFWPLGPCGWRRRHAHQIRIQLHHQSQSVARETRIGLAFWPLDDCGERRRRAKIDACHEHGARRQARFGARTPIIDVVSIA